MDREPAELSRERAVSSEPCSTRPNPFDDNVHSSRKRQRVDGGGSRSRSVDTARASDISEPMPLREETADMPTDPPSPPPTTPPPKTFDPLPTEPTSSRVTINLRTARPLDPIPSSPPSPQTPSKMNGEEDMITGLSVESESDVLSTAPAVETPSSSPSAVGSPHIELITEEDQDFGDQSPPVAIIGEDEIFGDPMQNFPYAQEGEPLVSTTKRLIAFIQYEQIEDEKCFVDVRDWIDNYLRYTSSHPDNWHESYSKHREFWLLFPEVLWALSWRSRFFGDFLRKSRDGRMALTDFMCQFARLAGRFVTMDVRTLSLQHKSDDDQEPDLASRGYLQAFGFLLRKHESSHIGRNLEAHYQWDWNEDIDLLMSNFTIEGGNLPALTKLVQGQLDMMSRNPKTIVESLIDPCRIARKIVDEAASLMDDQNLFQQHHAQTPQQLMPQAYEFFKVMSAGLESIIEKYYTFLTPDSAYNHIESLAMIFRHTLSSDNPATRDLLQRYQNEHPGLPFRFLPRVISCEWKFTILKKLISSTQMQLRVVGVTRMCNDLLEIYNGSKGPDPPSNPLLLYFAEFILNHKLVDYLVGPGSHPEIISESNNIVGFLIVTKTYRNAQTDKIWQTVMSSQDPRVVEAILRMLRKILALFDYQSLLYLCEKASSIPIEGFTAAAREFCDELFRSLMQKASSEDAQYIGYPPYDLCVRLIRQSSIVTAECPAGYPEIQNFIAGRFHELLLHGPSPEARQDIYLSCIKDITVRTSTASGSIFVINALLRQNARDLHMLCTEHGLTKLVIEELQTTIIDDRLSSNPSFQNSPASQARRELLLSIIINEPGTISPELGAQLWNLLVGSQSRSVNDRNISWQTLNSAVKKSTPNNVFIASCFADFLPNLPPDCFTIGALDFAREAIFSWLAEVRHDFVEEDRAFESPALEQLWHMILTAPPNTIDAPAINVLVEVYLDSQLIMSMPRPKARSIHLTLVDRCLKELATAANKLKTFNDSSTSSDEETMVLVASEDEFSKQEKIFARSLAVLREFLKAYQLKPQFSTPKSRSPTTAAQDSVEGEPLTLKYQSFDGDKHTEVKSLTLGKLNNAATLFASLEKATGFTNYKVFCGGKVFDPDEIDIAKSLNDLNLNGLVLVQRREHVEGGHSHGNKTSLELEMTKHFDELWGYLAMHEKVAQEIYYFLIKFPVYDRLLKDFASETTSHSEIFPLGQPFKSLYAVYGLRETIIAQSLKGTLSDESLTRAIALIIAAISDRDVIDQCPSEDLRDCLALHFIDCFVKFLNLKETALPTAVSPYLDDALLQRLLELLDSAKSAATTPNSVYLTGQSFEAILDASIHSPELWTLFKSHLSSNGLLRDLVLDDPRLAIRKSVMKQILSKCAFSPSLARVSTTDFTVAFWPLVTALIPHAVKQPQTCEETFTLSHQLLKRLGDTSIDSLNLDTLVGQWSALLLLYTPNETVGHPESVDAVAHGLANLLYCLASFSKASLHPLSSSNIGLQLLQEHLFPDLSSGETIKFRLPLLNTMTRQLLAETIYFLVKDDEQQYKQILLYLSNLVRYDGNIDDGPYFCELPFLFDRSKAIRSHTGYVGLRNLSNTCYLNSLFTQLYMNIPFREFMLTANVADGGASQKLLAETQSLFSYMQNSLKRFVDPAALANSIKTYDDGQIDVSIQMDVDEFYNLLFDRWEGQILSSDAKKKFRSFYGGQLVQQVKSKECSHISERLEPFSAIQCDIKGKSCLEESLQAYVDGEIMEGDNKYKCSTCDRHVDAVKRACLKDCPNNLIFHLKRFDFNLRTLTRSKINDHFTFPKKIDMRPYKVEHLTDSPEESAEDIFELTGILIHSGTAESGHYYSFIRERPSNSEKENWVEFNDDCVTTWDPNTMESSCFGGVDYRGTLDSGTLQYDKPYSAYMLFYQRSSVLALEKQSMEAKGLQSPIRLDISPQYSQHIALENELLMRKYCLYDRSHIQFVSKMLANVRNINKGTCSSEHVLEKLALTTALNHLDQVIARTKDLPDFPGFMLTLEQLCQSCAECSRDFLEWFCDCPEALRHQLLRNPDSLVRSRIARLILMTLNKVRTEAAYAYGFGDEEASDDGVEDDADPPRVIQKVVIAINKLWDIFDRNCRAWPEYFGLLANIAAMGDNEAALLLDVGFLRKTLEIINADHLLPMPAQYTRMLNILSKRIANRPVSFDSIIELLYRLLNVCDASAEFLHDGERRLEASINGGVIPLTEPERHHLMQHWTRGQAHILVEKLLQLNQNPQATRLILIILLHWPDSMDVYIYNAITHGIRKGPSPFHASSFFRAAIVYCEQSESPQAIPSMVDHVTKTAAGLDNTEGREFLQFFKNVFNLQSNNADIPKDDIDKYCMEKVPRWAPTLLSYYETIVRQETEDFLQDLILRHPPNIDYGVPEAEAAKARFIILTAQKLGVTCLEYLQSTYIRDRQQAIRTNLLSIQSVIENCSGFFDEDGNDQLTLHFFHLRSTVLPKLKQYTVEEQDEEISDWDGSEEEYGSSEPMDSLADVDNDVQL